MEIKVKLGQCSIQCKVFIPPLNLIIAAVVVNGNSSKEAVSYHQVAFIQ